MGYGAGLYGHHLVNPAVSYTTPLVSNVATVAAKPIVPTVVKAPVVSYNYGIHTPLTTGYTHLIKREADSEAQPEAEADPALLINGAYPSVYGGLYGHQLVNPAVTYTTPLVSNVATVAAKPIVPTIVKTPVVSY